jgi:hypothetical protein
MSADKRGFFCRKKAQRAQRWGERPSPLRAAGGRPQGPVGRASARAGSSGDSPHRLRLTAPRSQRGFNRVPAESAARSALPHPLRLDRGESNATLAQRMGEGLGVRALGGVSKSSFSWPSRDHIPKFAPRASRPGATSASPRHHAADWRRVSRARTPRCSLVSWRAGDNHARNNHPQRVRAAPA